MREGVENLLSNAFTIYSKHYLEIVIHRSATKLCWILCLQVVLKDSYALHVFIITLIHVFIYLVEIRLTYPMIPKYKYKPNRRFTILLTIQYLLDSKRDGSIYFMHFSESRLFCILCLHVKYSIFV